MISDGFQHERLLAFVSRARSQRAQSIGIVGTPLTPQFAAQCYARIPFKGNAFETRLPTTAEIGRLQEAQEAILCMKPMWRPYFDIPLDWQVLVGRFGSSSHPLIPQTICIGEKSIGSPQYLDALSEYVIHELSHVWIGMMTEIFSVSRYTNSEIQLPSGTRGKNLTQALFALTFAVTLLHYYTERERNYLYASPHATERRCFYFQYSRSLLDTIVGRTELTVFGRAIVETCQLQLWRFASLFGDQTEVPT